MLQIKLVVVSEDLISKKPVVLMVKGRFPLLDLETDMSFGVDVDVSSTLRWANLYFEKITRLDTRQINLKLLKITSEGFDDVAVFTHYYGCFLPSDIPSPDYEWVEILTLVDTITTEEYEIITHVAN